MHLTALATQHTRFAGRPEPESPSRIQKVGGISAEGQRGNLQTTKPETEQETRVPLGAHGTSTHDRHHVGVLLGGCGDARHFLATLLHAADPEHCSDLSKLKLQFVLNDIVPEATARVYVLCCMLHCAAMALPTDVGDILQEGSGALHKLPREAVVALSAFWCAACSAVGACWHLPAPTACGCNTGGPLSWNLCDLGQDYRCNASAQLTCLVATCEGTMRLHRRPQITVNVFAGMSIAAQLCALPSSSSCKMSCAMPQKQRSHHCLFSPARQAHGLQSSAAAKAGRTCRCLLLKSVRKRRRIGSRLRMLQPKVRWQTPARCACLRRA